MKRASTREYSQPTHLSGETYFRTFRWKGRVKRQYLIRTQCSHCGKEMFRDRSNARKHSKHRPVCGKECQYAGLSGPGNPKWGGGRKNKRGSKGGHILAYAPDHPHARKNFVPEHRLIMERILGRFLTKEEVVHHIDCDPANNSTENLTVLQKGPHHRVHATLESCVKALLERRHLRFNCEEERYEPCL